MPDKQKQDIVDQLADFPAFADCSRSDLSALVEAGGTVTLPAGWPFMSEGEPADACYVLLEGTGRVFLRRVEVAQLGPGDIIGEMAFLAGGQRGATVTSSSRVRALRVENEALSALVNRHRRIEDTLRAAYAAHTAPSS